MFPHLPEEHDELLVIGDPSRDVEEEESPPPRRHFGGRHHRLPRRLPQLLELPGPGCNSIDIFVVPKSGQSLAQVRLGVLRHVQTCSALVLNLAQNLAQFLAQFCSQNSRCLLNCTPVRLRPLCGDSCRPRRHLGDLVDRFHVAASHHDN